MTGHRCSGRSVALKPCGQWVDSSWNLRHRLLSFIGADELLPAEIVSYYIWPFIKRFSQQLQNDLWCLVYGFSQ